MSFSCFCFFNSSYLSANGCFKIDTIRTAFNNHRTEGMVEECDPVDLFLPLQSPVSWQQQLKYISSIPNFHKWEQRHVSFSQWLSVRDVKEKYKPASARNQILFYFHEGLLQNVFGVCSRLQNHVDEPRQSSSTFVSQSFVSESVENIPSAPKRRRREPIRRLTIDDLVANITSTDPQFSPENLYEASSRYETFKLAMIDHGHLFWRHSSGKVDIFAMNDVSMTTGLFQEDCYAHITLVNIDGVYELYCSCSMYTILMQLASLGVSEEEFAETDITNVRCCHMQLFNEMIFTHMPALISNTSKSENNLVRKLELVKGQINDPVCHLPTSSNRSLKFSVYSDHDNKCSFVHITDNRICCQSGYCDALFSSSKRYVIHLDKAEVLCPHLRYMKDHRDHWIDLLPETVTCDLPGTGVSSDDEMDETNVPPLPPLSQLPLDDPKVIHIY